MLFRSDGVGGRPRTVIVDDVGIRGEIVKLSNERAGQAHISNAWPNRFAKHLDPILPSNTSPWPSNEHSRLVASLYRPDAKLMHHLDDTSLKIRAVSLEAVEDPHANTGFPAIMRWRTCGIMAKRDSAEPRITKNRAVH